LLTGEYLVMDGAKALALPLKLGQAMNVKNYKGSDIVWKSYDNKGELWFEGKASLYNFEFLKCTNEKTGKFLSRLLNESVRLNSVFLSTWKGYKIETFLEFPADWGLGSSSSILFCASQWAEVNPYYLYFRVFDGSGYDVACAGADGPLIYQLKDDSLDIKYVDFNPTFSNKLYFVYSGNKVDTNAGIREYRKLKGSRKAQISEITEITELIIKAKTLSSFERLLVKHESILSGLLDIPEIKKTKFPDYWGVVKSLGAWGGDFLLVTSTKSEEETRAYFAAKGLEIFYPFKELVL